MNKFGKRTGTRIAENIINTLLYANLNENTKNPVKISYI